MARHRMAAGTLLCALALGGCASPVAGPIALGGDPGEICIPGEPGQPVVLGDVLGLSDGEEATITAVTIVDPDNVTLEASYILDSPIGAMYPDEIDDWDARVEAAGTTITAGQTSIVVVLTRDGDDRGTASHMKVDYTSRGIAYEANGTTAFVIDDDCY